MKKQTKLKLIILIASSIFTCFLYHEARMSAIVERGNADTIGGEFLLWLIPLVAELVYENVILSRSVFTKRADSRSKRCRTSGIASVDRTKTSRTLTGGNYEI